MGHEVFTPTLTGLGDRRHLLSPSIDLALHVEDVANVLFFEDRHEVILVGHSYSGLVISGAANTETSRIRRLVFLDASIPEDGRRIVDLLPEDRRRRLEEALRRDEVAEPPVLDDQPFGLSDHDSIEWLTDRLVPQPMTRAMLYSEIPSMTPEARQIPKTFINCTMTPDRERRELLVRHGYSYQELATGHDAMVTAPDELASILQELA